MLSQGFREFDVDFCEFHAYYLSIQNPNNLLPFWNVLVVPTITAAAARRRDRISRFPQQGKLFSFKFSRHLWYYLEWNSCYTPDSPPFMTGIFRNKLTFIIGKISVAGYGRGDRRRLDRRIFTSGKTFAVRPSSHLYYCIKMSTHMGHCIIPT